MIPLTFVLPSFTGGGAERVTLMVLRELDRRRFRPSLVVLSGKGPLKSLVPEDVPITDLVRPRIRHALRALRRVLNAQQPQVVFSTMSHLNFGVLALKPFLKQPPSFVVREANIPLAGLPASKARLSRTAYRRLYCRAHKVISPASTVAAAVENVSRLKSGSTLVIANPVDKDFITGRAFPPVREPGPGLRLVAVGRLTRQKGFDSLIRMMPELPEATHLTIIGEGPERPTLERQIDHAGAGGRIALPGFSDNPWRWMAGADVVLLPSRWEGLPNVVLEALACGTPVVALATAGGIGDIATEAPEAVTVTGDETAFRDAVLACSLNANGEALSDSLLPGCYALSAVVLQYEAMFEDVIANEAQG